MAKARLTMPSNFAEVEAGIREIEDKQILFVTGAAKSGTTWIQLLLDAHPEVACRGEGSFFEKFAGGLQKLCNHLNEESRKNRVLKGPEVPPFPEFEIPLILHLLRQSVLGCLATYGAEPKIRVIGEKTPSTALGLDAVQACFPDAKILHVVRDGRDVCVSAWHHNLRDSRGDITTFMPSFAEFMPFMTDVWLKHQRPPLKLQETRPDALKMVRYEDLIAAPKETLLQICQWLGVASDSETLSACSSAADFRSLTGGRAPGQEDPNSFFRSGTSGGWRKHFSDHQAEQFWAMAGSEMARLGYER